MTEDSDTTNISVTILDWMGAEVLVVEPTAATLDEDSVV